MSFQKQILIFEMKYIELLNGFKEIDKEVEAQLGWTPSLHARFADLCFTMMNPVKCNIITYGDIDQERDTFLGRDQISELFRLRNKLVMTNHFQNFQMLTTAECFGFRRNFYSTINDWCIDYITDVCFDGGKYDWIAEFCNILAVASDLTYDWIDPDSIKDVVFRHDGKWEEWGKYIFTDVIYRQSNDNLMSYNHKKKSEHVFNGLSQVLACLNIFFMEENKDLKIIVESNKNWIATLADRYLGGYPRRRSGCLVKNNTYYDHCFTMLGLIWEKLGYEKVRY